MHDEVADTDRYVETVSLLAADPAVQEAVVTRLTNLIATRLDVGAVTQQALDALAVAPAATSGGEQPVLLSTLLADGVGSLIEKACRPSASPSPP